MQLNYKDLGQGEPLIILHGMFGMLDNWITIGKQLSKHYSVYLIDQRNHGKSPHAPEINYKLMAEDLREFMEAHCIHKAHIMGHSMGGKTAMQFAMDYPEMLNKLIVVDIGPWENRTGHDMIFEGLFSLDLNAIQSRKEAEAKLGESIKNTSIRQFLLKNLSRDREGTYRWKMNLSSLYKNYQSILAPISEEYPFEGATLFLNGGKSNYINKEDIPKIEAQFPAAKVVTIENVGHWIHTETPQAVIVEVKRFLEA